MKNLKLSHSLIKYSIYLRVFVLVIIKCKHTKHVKHEICNQQHTTYSTHVQPFNKHKKTARKTARIKVLNFKEVNVETSPDTHITHYILLL